MKIVLMVIFFIFIARIASGATYYELRDTDNTVVTVVSEPAANSKGLLDLISANSCDQGRYSRMKKLQLFEADLELDFLISNLAIRHPRKTTRMEKALLKKAPRCGTYLARMKVVDYLLKGYTYVGLKQGTPQKGLAKTLQVVKATLGSVFSF